MKLRHLCLIIVILIISATIRPVLGQSIEQNEIKTAYILNFLKHITWNQEKELTSFRIAVFGDTTLYRTLKGTASNKFIREKPISVHYISNPLNLANFQVIVVANENSSYLSEIFKKHASNRLIISDDGALKHSMINFFVQDNKLQFELNEVNLTKANLQSSEYLKGISITDIEIQRTKILETDRLVQVANEAIRNQTNTIEEQKKEISRRINELHNVEKNFTELLKNSDSLRNDINNQKNSLAILRMQIEQDEVEISKKETLLKKLLTEQLTAEFLNRKQRDQIKSQRTEIIAQSKTMTKNIKYLEALKKEIDKQKETIIKGETVVQKQKYTIIIIVAILVFIGGLSIIIYRSNRIKHFANIELEDKNKKIRKQADELEAKSEKLAQIITELQMTQDQLIQSEKMAALGGMVAGVAHEINTPVGIGVTAISHLHSKYQEFINLLEHEKIKKSDLIKFLQVVDETTLITQNNLDRAAMLVQNFKQVSVDQSSEDKRKIFIEKYINDVILNLTHEFKHSKIAINVICEEDFEINTYPGAISQIITNLLMNAKIHAFDKNQKGFVEINIKKQATNFLLTISDNGKGIPEENIHKVFEPFFTTKRKEGGSGLGLSIIHTFVKNQLQGEIVLKSQLNTGTKFTLTLPLNIT